MTDYEVLIYEALQSGVEPEEIMKVAENKVYGGSK